MSDYPKPAGLDAFARCPTPGCATDVYAPLLIPVRCRAHGGPGSPEITEPDPFGNTQRAEQAGPLPRPAPAS